MCERSYVSTRQTLISFSTHTNVLRCVISLVIIGLTAWGVVSPTSSPRPLAALASPVDLYAYSLGTARDTVDRILKDLFLLSRFFLFDFLPFSISRPHVFPVLRSHVLVHAHILYCILFSRVLNQLGHVVLPRMPNPLRQPHNIVVEESNFGHCVVVVVVAAIRVGERAREKQRNRI